MSGLLAEYEAPAVERGWMWTLRGATLVLLLLLLGPAVYSWFASANHQISFLLPAMVYGGLLWALRENPPSKGALAAAVGMSAFPVGLALLGIVLLAGDAMRGVARPAFHWEAPWALLAVLQVVLLAGTLACTHTLKLNKKAAGATWVVRIAAVASIALLLRPVWWNAWATWEYGYLGYLWSLLWQLGGALLCGVVLWAQRKEFAEFNREARGTMMLTAGTGAYLLIYTLGNLLASLLMGSGEPKGSSILPLLFLGGILLSNGVLAGSAIRVYYKLGRQTGDVGKLVGALFLAGLCWAIFVSLSGEELRREHHQGRGNAASAIGSLRTINTCEVTYESTYGKGFSPTLAALGPPLAGDKPSAAYADLIDSVLASGQKTGYNFVYTAGPPDKEGRIMSYTVVARPATAGVSGNSNFFTDETGVIRATKENRAANGNDPPI
ncbi:MAG: hypothetical protein M1453_00865 [Acidobacteria bacterium]|nr:hypothetical protein [Acidobacteriota bacterium]